MPTPPDHLMIGGIKRLTGGLWRQSWMSSVLRLLDRRLTGNTVPLRREYERGLADEDEVILSVPGHRLDELITGLRSNNSFGLGYKLLNREMEFDFKRPPFYNDLFELWGCDRGEDWTR